MRVCMIWICFLIYQICQMLLLFLEGGQREVFILEVCCSFDYSMEQAFAAKLLKYQTLVSRLNSLGYQCKLVVLIFGGLGQVDSTCVQIAGLHRTKAKHLARSCSVPAVMGSLAVWIRRLSMLCYLICGLK